MPPAPPRYAPGRPLPPYAHVPGRTPHPVRDPHGHSHGRPPERSAALDPARWQESDLYLHGIDLFNHGYGWEAHEAWEALWHACGRSGPAADALKGLIHLAAAGVKHREGRPLGVTGHARRAAELFRSVAAARDAREGPFLGLPPAEMIELAEAIHRDGWPEEPPRLWLTYPRG